MISGKASEGSVVSGKTLVSFDAAIVSCAAAHINGCLPCEKCGKEFAANTMMATQLKNSSPAQTLTFTTAYKPLCDRPTVSLSGTRMAHAGHAHLHAHLRWSQIDLLRERLDATSMRLLLSVSVRCLCSCADADADTAPTLRAAWSNTKREA